MPGRDNFPAIFEQLASIFRPLAPHLVVKADGPHNYSLDAPASPKHPHGLFFGAVQVKKNYVSYHLMPVYVFPDLLESVPDTLKRRMQGKSCFNFTALDETAVAAVADLTAAGLERYRREQLL